MRNAGNVSGGVVTLLSFAFQYVLRELADNLDLPLAQQLDQLATDRSSVSKQHG